MVAVVTGERFSMTKYRLTLLNIAATTVLGCASIGVVATACAAETRAVLELFTSQGCDSCPAADRLLGELSKEPTLIAMTNAVDYWDYLGWKDTLALAGHGNRQRAYARSRGDRDVFTPQMIVNGAAQALGSDRAQIERAIVQTRKIAGTLSFPVNLTVVDGKLTINAPAGKTAAEKSEVWLCPMSKTVPVAITRGENKGKSITYHNVVRRWIKVGEWNGAAASWTLPVADFKVSTVDQVAVIIQQGTAALPGPMLAAAMTPLK
jgi:hypothetical protein